MKKLTKDLRGNFPRSPREKLSGYVIAARCVDKCQSFLLGVNGDYNYWPCSLASQWFSFTGLTPETFKFRPFLNRASDGLRNLKLKSSQDVQFGESKTVVFETPDVFAKVSEK